MLLKLEDMNSMKIIIAISFFYISAFSQYLSPEQEESVQKVLYDARTKGTKEKNVTKDPFYESFKKKLKWNKKFFESNENLIQIYEKEQKSRDVLMRACAEIALGKNTTLLAMGRKKEKNYWKIKAQLSYLEEKSIVDEYIYLCMTDHKIWFCSEKK